MEVRNLRITKVVLENIRCFERIELDLAAGAEQTAALSVVLGDNGVGKSTLLKSLALGLSSPKAAGVLFEMSGQPWLRRGALHGCVRLEFNTGDFTEIAITLATFGETIQHHENSVKELLHEELLICGYGATRRAFGDKSFSAYSMREAVAGLFDYDTRLQNPELVLRRLLSQAQLPVEAVLRRIDNILLLLPGSVHLGEKGLEIQGPWGSYTPVGAVSDGYKATLAWVLDLLGWAMYRDPLMLETGFRGIVLIDEIEQHLHPQWQRQIYQRLTEQFPGVQFITTTHSPLCVIGTTDLADEEVSLIHLRRSGDAVTALSGLQPPRGMRADQVLTSYLFGLETSGDNETKRQVERLSELLGKQNLTPDEFAATEQAEVVLLKQALNQKLGSGESDLERRVSRAAQELVQHRVAGFAASLEESAPPLAVDFEVKRQFQELFKKL